MIIYSILLTQPSPAEPVPLSSERIADTNVNSILMIRAIWLITHIMAAIDGITGSNSRILIPWRKHNAPVLIHLICDRCLNLEAWLVSQAIFAAFSLHLSVKHNLQRSINGTMQFWTGSILITIANRECIPGIILCIAILSQ